MKHTSSTPNHPIIGLSICLIGLLAIAFSISLRIEPTLLQQDILRLFHVSSDTLDDLIMHYQYSLIVTLVIAGVIVDYVGPRRVLALAIIAAIAGNILFGTATTISGMVTGRIVMGYAHPFILISALKLGTVWLPKKYFSFFAGVLFATLLMTSIITKPFLTLVASQAGITEFTLLADGIGCLLLLMLMLTKREPTPLIKPRLRDIAAVLRQSTLWILCVISCLGWIANTFLLNFGKIFLIKNLNFTHALTVSTINTTFTCFSVGAIVTGILAGFFYKKQLVIAWGYLFAAITVSVVFYVPQLAPNTASLLIAATGFFAGSAVVCYAKAYDIGSRANAGTAFALIAFITTLGNTLYAMGMANRLEGVLPTLLTTAADTWQILLALIPAALLIGATLAFLMRKNAANT
jgi:predicted MFS family arabinose efflux permease